MGCRKSLRSRFLRFRALSPAELALSLGLDQKPVEDVAKEFGRVARPPFFAFPIRPGITFTCEGVKSR